MADLIMDNPLASQPQLNKIAQDTIDCILELKREFTETRTPINDDNQTLHRFCAKLEQLFKVEMKEKSTMLGRRKDYYDFFCDCLSTTKGLNDGIKFVKSTGEYKTTIGRGRAFIRFSLVHQRLADTVQQCVMNGKQTSDWYTLRSVWLNQTQKNAIITSLYELNEINFDLQPRGYDLDNAWPSFSKQAGGFSQGNWNPPSRASSYSSLASLPYQESFVPRERRDTTSTTMSEVDLDVSERSPLEERLDELQQSNENMSETLTARNLDLSRLTSDLNTSQERYKLLEQEIKFKEKMWTEKEDDLKKEKNELTDKVKNLDEKLEEMRNSLLTAEKSLAVTECELRGQIQVRERELESVQNTLSSNTSTSKEGIQSLQDKINSLETKNQELLDKMETMVVSRDSEANGQLETANKLHSLLENLKSAEHDNIQLRSYMEEKNRQISELESRLNEAEQQLQSSDDKLSVAQEELNNSQKSWEDNEITLLQQQRGIQSELSTAKTQSEALNKQLEDQTNTVIELKEEVSQLTAENLSISKKCNDRETEHRSLSEALENQDQLQSERETEVSSLKSSVNEKEAQIDTLKMENKDLTQCKEKLETDLTNQSAECLLKIEELNQCVADKEEGLKTLVDHLFSRLDDTLPKGSNIQQMKITNDEILKEKVHLLDKLLENQRISLAETELKSANLHSDLAVAKQESSEQGRQLEIQGKEINQLKDMNGALQHIETDAQSRSDKDASLLQLKDDRIKTLEIEVQENLQKISLLEGEILEKSAEIAEKNNNLAEMSASIQRTNTELTQKKENEGKLNRTIQEKHLILETTLSDERQKNESLVAEKEQLNSHIENLKKSVTDFESKLEQAQTSSASEKQAILTGTEKVLEEIRGQLKGEQECKKALTDRVQSLTKQLEEFKSENCDLNSKCESKLKEITQLNDENVKLQRELDEELIVVSNLADKDELSKKLSVVISEKENLIADLQNTVSSLTKMNEDMKDKNESGTQDITKELDTLRAEIESWKTAADNEKEASLILRAEREELKDEVDYFRLEHESIDKKMDALKVSLVEKENAIEVSRLQLEGDRRAIENEIEVRDQEVQALKFQLSSQQLQHEQALGKYMEQESNIANVTDRMGDQERVIEQLENEMCQIKQAREEERNKHVQQLTEVKIALETKEEEFQLLSSKLVELSTNLAEEKNNSSILQHQLEVNQNFEQLLAKSRDENTLLKKDNSLLKGDISQLKRKLIHLIKEKDVLWQKTDSLVYQQRIQAAEKWMEDGKVNNCLGCRIEFSFTTRKHHCRQCGRIFCWNCSNNWLMTAHSNKKARVCNSCFIKHNEADGTMNSSLISNESDDDEAGLQGSLRVPRQTEDTVSQGSGSLEVPRQTEDTVSQGSASGATSPSLDYSGLLSGDTDSLSSSDIRDTDTPDSMADGNRYSGNETDDNKQDRQQLPQAPHAEFTSTTDELTASPAAPLDEEKEDRFHVISEEEIEKSLSGSLNSPPPSLDVSITASLMITVDDLEKGHVNRDNEVWLKAGKRFAVPLLINKMGVILCWEFTSQPKDIGFSATYAERETTPAHEAQVLIQPCKCNSHKQTVRGELTAKKHGIYTLMFDNTYSKLTTKKLCYSLYLKKTK